MLGRQTQNIQLQYFQKASKELNQSSRFSSHGRKLVDLVKQKIEKKILVSQIKLPDRIGEDQLKIKKKINQSCLQSQQSLLKKVENQKAILKQKIKQITNQQFDLKSKIKSNSLRQKNLYNPYLNQQSKERAKQVILQNRLFEKQIKAKSKQIAKLYFQRSLQELRKYQQMKQQKKQMKRNQVIQKLKSLQMKSTERKQFLEESKKIHKSIKDKKYLYILNSQKEIEDKQQKQKQYESKLEQFKRNLKINFQQVKEHERKYNQHLQESNAKSYQKYLEKSRQQRSKSYADNYFRILGKQSLERQKQQQSERINHAHDFKQRVCKFQQKLSAEFRPKKSKQSIFKPIKQTMSARALTSLEQREKGMEYLSIAKKLKDLKKEQQKRIIKASPQAITHYKDYTKDFKYREKSKPEIQFDQIVNNKSITSFQSVSKAMQLANQINAKSKLNNDKKLFNSVKNKIELLNAII